MRRDLELPSGTLNELPVNLAPTIRDIELVIPAVLQDKLSGFLLLGEKLSGKRYSEEDLDLLIPLIEEAFIAIERLRLQESVIVERTEKEKLEELNNLKSEFIGHVSHELRTPLTSISLSIENLLEGIPERPKPAVMDYLKRIQESSEHLRRMIENLLDITRIEAGKIKMDRERLPLDEEINRSIEVIQPLAGKKDCTITFDNSDGAIVIADRGWLQVILTNLLDNAVKYSHEGTSIQVSVDAYELDAVAVHITDQGSGIAPDPVSYTHLRAHET